MKSILLFFSVTLITQVWSQQVKLSQQNQTFSVGSKNAYAISIPYATKTQVEDKLKDFLRDFGKSKSSKGEYVVLLGDNKSMGDKPFDVYAMVLTEKDGSQLAVFAVDLGGAFMNSKEHSNQSQAFEQLLVKFGKECANKAIDEEIEIERKELRSIEKDQQSLEKDLNNYEKDIENYKKLINETENKISDVKSNQVKKKDAFKTQEEKIESIEKKRKTLN